MGTTPAKEQGSKAKLMKNNEDDKPVREQQVPHFKNSSNYEELVNLIGKNRKFIQT